MRYRSFLPTVCLCLFSCGGGGSDQTSLAVDGGQVADYAATGAFRSGRTVAFSVFDGGLVYLFYQSDYSVQPFPVYAYAGFFVGITTDTGANRVYQGTDFDFDAAAAYPSTLSLGFGAPYTSAGGQLIHLGTSDSMGDPVYGAYSTISTQSTTPTISGQYTAYVRSVTSSLAQMTATVDSKGGLAVNGGGCNVNGSLLARPFANVYDASVSLVGSCPAASGTYTGHAFQSYLTGNIYLMVTDPSGREGVFVHLYAPS